MKQADVIVGSGAALLAVLAAWPGNMEAFRTFTHHSPYVSSFLQVAVLTTFGECLALRLRTGRYSGPGFGLACRALTWGLLGMCIFMCFTIFSSGAQPVLRSLGIASSVDMHGPFSLAKLPVSFVISVTMNCIWAPMMIILHKLSDSHIEATGGSLARYLTTKPDIAGAFGAINWTIMWGFVLRKTIPLFWIPAHTIIFLLPTHLQVLLTALLGIVLGVVLSLAAQSARGSGREGLAAAAAAAGTGGTDAQRRRLKASDLQPNVSEHGMIEYIDQEKCVGCGTCTKTCPLDVFRIDPRQPELAPCMAACPAGIDVRTDHALVQQGKVLEALENLKKSQPFPAITGRVCFHPCEGACSRNEVDAAVNINGLEQFLGDVDLDCEQAVPARRHIAKVAVVGSGPAGLACAYFLADLGYGVTVFEAGAEPGGMLRYGIPAYRLPDAVIWAQVAKLETMGVRFRCNTRVGREADLSLDDLLNDGFSAVFLALGTTVSRKLALPGSDLPGVSWGLEFLRAVRSGEAPKLSGKVLVVGGGDVAVDAAITARRLGAAQVVMACLEPEGGMPAYPHNLADAEREGITFHCSLGPARIIEKDGRAGGVEFTSCLSVCDASGAFNPTFDETCVSAIEADAVIFAIGQASELDGFAGEMDMARGRIIADPVTFATSRWGVFAAGDAVTGPASVVRAIAGGREAALSIDRMLRGAELKAGRDRARPELPKERLPGKDIAPQPRNERPLLAPNEAPGFAEPRAGFDLHEAFAEANRCMTCGSKARVAYDDDCMTCFSCELRCPSGAINVHPFKERMPRTLEMLFMPAGRTVR